MKITVLIGTGTDVAIESADVVLMSGDLRGVVNAIEVSQATMRNIRQNLIWAFGYNAVGVCLAASGLLNPAIAAVLMIASGLVVISNSLSLLGAT
mgnify:CR=1 FL=1